MSLHKVKLITGCIVLVIMCLVFGRDWLLEKGGTPDLRNRIVGARLQKDGKEPYFYKWHDGDTVRYYDVSNIGTGVSNISSSPFFHTLLYPIADLPQRTLSRIWFFMEYLFLMISGLLALRLAKNKSQTILISVAFTLFILTEAWRTHIILGQVYIMMAFFCMVIYYCLSKRENLVAAFIAGLASIVLLLIRPNSFVFFIPFLFLVNRYSRKYLIAFLIPVVLIPAIHFSFESNRTFWKQYPTALQESINVHQGLNKPDTTQKPIPLTVIEKWEGWDRKAITKVTESIDFYQYSEHANFFVLYQNIFKKRMSVGMMKFLGGFSIIVLLSLYFFTRKKFDTFTLPNIALLGFCLYMIGDFSSPIWRHQYYTVQWLFPLLVAATVYKPANKWLYAGLLFGLLLNIINTDYIKMEHTIGEYLIFIIVLYMSLGRRLGETTLIKEKN
jgi:hypothetical protein